MAMSMGSFSTRVVPAVIVATDGTGDFTTIQAAIDALLATGGRVFVREGTYTITVAIAVNKPDVTLEGSGNATLIEVSAGINGIDITQARGEVKNLKIHGAAFSGVGIYINGAAAVDCRVTNCNIDGMGVEGIWVSGTADRPIIDGNRIENCMSAGILISSENAVTVINNICNDNNDGIAVVSAADSRISGNRCDSNTSYGINLQVENIRIIISNNNCSSNGIDGINLWPTGGNPIDNCIIECNICYDNTGWGINIRNADASATIVSGNILIDNTGGEFNNLGTDTQIGHNITS